MPCETTGTGTVRIGESDLLDSIEFVVDPDAEPGDVLASLAQILVDLAQSRAPGEECS